MIKWAHKDLKFLHYMAPVEHVDTILEFGIFARGRLGEAKSGLRDIADSEVVGRRINRRMPNGAMLVNYVPLYISLHTPMQYVLTHSAWTKGRKAILRNEELVFIDLDTNKVFSIGGVFFTDGNAASSSTKFFADVSELDKLDWRTICSVHEYPSCYDREWQRKKASEVLVPEHVPPECIRRIVCYSDESLERARSSYSGHVPFEVDRYYYLQ